VDFARKNPQTLLTKIDRKALPPAG
jgi:hypothetical protein